MGWEFSRLKGGRRHLTCGHVLLGPIMLGKEREDAGEGKTVLMGFGDV